MYCGQTAGWIKLPLGTQVGLGLDHIVLDGDPDPLQRGTAPQSSAHVYRVHSKRWPISTHDVALAQI